MPLILLIDTALETASVGIARDGNLLLHKENDHQQDHAAWLHGAIQSLLNESGISLNEVNAVGVTAGPGSYTGLRVGMAAAKGICYAQNIPLICVSTLQLLAAGVEAEDANLIISLIDARRDEVYAGVYNRDLEPLQPECAMILEPNSFQDLLPFSPIALTGNGATKAMKWLSSKHFRIEASKQPIKYLASITYKKFLSRDFADLAYHEPVYIKEFYTTAKDK